MARIQETTKQLEQQKKIKVNLHILVTRNWQHRAPVAQAGADLGGFRGFSRNSWDILTHWLGLRMLEIPFLRTSSFKIDPLQYLEPPSLKSSTCPRMDQLGVMQFPQYELLVLCRSPGIYQIICLYKLTSTGADLGEGQWVHTPPPPEMKPSSSYLDQSATPFLSGAPPPKKNPRSVVPL